MKSIRLQVARAELRMGKGRVTVLFAWGGTREE